MTVAMSVLQPIRSDKPSGTNRRNFMMSGAAASAALFLSNCVSNDLAAGTEGPFIMTVQGAVPIKEMGWTLTHEHISLDLRPLAVQRKIPQSASFGDVSAIVLPHLMDLKRAGAKTIVGATASGFGKSPEILRRLSMASGLNVITATGVYLTADRNFVPDYAYEESREELALRWISEFETGIDENSVRPGMIKLGIDGGDLSDLDQKVIDAAAMAHLQTGLVIGVHIGPWQPVPSGFLAKGAFQVIERLKASGVSPSAFVWIHAQNEAEFETTLQAAEMGAYVSFDGFRAGQEDTYVEHLRRFRDAGILSQVHLSQDAGWYSFGENGGGEFSAYTPIFNELVPYLHENGFTQMEMNRIFAENPASAFQVRKRFL